VRQGASEECRGERAEKNMKRKITILTLCAMLFALSVSAEAQQAGKVPRIGLLPYVGSSSQEANPACNQCGMAGDRSLCFGGYFSSLQSALLSSPDPVRLAPWEQTAWGRGVESPKTRPTFRHVPIGGHAFFVPIRPRQAATSETLLFLIF
jgi:hypothetical protein